MLSGLKCDVICAFHWNCEGNVAGLGTKWMLWRSSMNIYCIFFVCLKKWSERIKFQVQNDVFCLYLSLPVEDIASIHNHLYHIQNKNYKYCILEYEVLCQNRSIASKNEFKPFHTDASPRVRYAQCLKGLQLCRIWKPRIQIFCKISQLHHAHMLGKWFSEVSA